MKAFFVFSTFFCLQLTFAVKPIKQYVDNPKNSPLKFEEVVLTTSDDYKLNTWVCYPKNEKKLNRTLLVAYGDSGNMSYVLRQSLEFVNQGYNVVLFDYRGFGESQDFATEENVLYYDEFVEDFKTVLQYTKKKFDTPIGVWAMSMGTVVAVLAYPEVSYDYLIADGFIIDPKKTADKIKDYLQTNVSTPPSADDYGNSLSRLSLPILFFAGNRDGLTTVEESNRAKPLNVKSQVIVFNGGHLQGFQMMTKDYHGQKYIEGVNDFYESIYPNTTE